MTVVLFNRDAPFIILRSRFDLKRSPFVFSAMTLLMLTFEQGADRVGANLVVGRRVECGALCFPVVETEVGAAREKALLPLKYLVKVVRL